MILIDNQEYEYDDLSPDAKSNLQMMQACDQEIAHLNNQLAIVQTARVAYANAVRSYLPSALEVVQANESLKFN